MQKVNRRNTIYSHKHKKGGFYGVCARTEGLNKGQDKGCL